MIARVDSGWMYAAQEEGTPLVKIGFTQCPNPYGRLRLLHYQIHAPVALVALVYVERVVRHMERAVHDTLAASRIEGEWFYLHMDQTYLASLIQHLMPQVLLVFMEQETRRAHYLMRPDKRKKIVCRAERSPHA